MLAAVGTFAFAHAQVATVSTTLPEIKWETKNIDFGKVVKGDETNSTRYFKFTNIGREPLVLSNCQASCRCVVVGWAKEPIAPGKTGTIKVHYDVNLLGTFNKSVTVSSNAKNNNEIVTITGSVE